MRSSDDLSPEERRRIKRQNREAWREEWFGESSPRSPDHEPPRRGSWITGFLGMIFEIGMRVLFAIVALYVIGLVIKTLSQ